MEYKLCFFMISVGPQISVYSKVLKWICDNHIQACVGCRLKCGSMEYYDKQYDRVTTKNEKRMKRIDRVFHKVTTTDDPIIRQVWDLDYS